MEVIHHCNWLHKISKLTPEKLEPAFLQGQSLHAQLPVGGRQGEEVQNVDGQEHEDHQAEVDQAEVDQDEEQDEQEAEGAAVDDSDEFPEDWIHLNF